MFIVCVCVCVLSCFSHVWLFATLCTITYQAPLSIGFSRQEYWNGLLCPFSGNLLNPGIEPMSSVLAGGFFTAESEGKPQYMVAVLFTVKSNSPTSFSQWKNLFYFNQVSLTYLSGISWIERDRLCGSGYVLTWILIECQVLWAQLFF